MTTDVKEVTEENEVTGTRGDATPVQEVRLRPAADVYRNENSIRILMDVPGASEEDVDVQFHDGVLTVNARVERADSQTRLYDRSFRLDRRMDTSSIEAEIQRGVLTLVIPFHEEARPRRIEVKTA